MGSSTVSRVVTGARLKATSWVRHDTATTRHVACSVSLFTQGPAREAEEDVLEAGGLSRHGGDRSGRRRSRDHRGGGVVTAQPDAQLVGLGDADDVEYVRVI